jgi:hypothetical protein
MGLDISIRESGGVTILDLQGKSTISGSESERLSGHLQEFDRRRGTGQTRLPDTRSLPSNSLKMGLLPTMCKSYSFASLLISSNNSSRSF